MSIKHRLANIANSSSDILSYSSPEDMRRSSLMDHDGGGGTWTDVLDNLRLLDGGVPK